MKLKLGRLDKIRKARSVNDILDILKDIAVDLKLEKSNISNLEESIAAEEDEIRIDHTGTKPKVSTRPKPSSSDLFQVKLKFFKVPPKKTLETNLKSLSKLYENSLELDAAEALILQSFKGSKNQAKALAGVKALKKEVTSIINRALQAVNKIASEHIPSEMEILGNKLLSDLLELVDKKSYKHMERGIYVATVKSEIHFSLYISIRGLKTSTGFVFDEYYVILTGAVDSKGNIKYYLNALPDYKTPGTYPLGELVSSEQEMLTRLQLLLATNDVSSIHDVLPMPLTPDRVRTSGLAQITGVDTAVVTKNKLVVKLKKTAGPTVVNNVLVKVLPLLNLLVGNSNRKKSVIQYESKPVRGVPTITFILTPVTKEEQTSKYTINAQKLDDIQEALGLTEEDVSAIKQALKFRV